MKTFTDIVENKMSDFFMEVKEMPQLSGFVTNGFPIAVAAYLSSEMYDEGKNESELVLEGPAGKIMKFSLSAIKKGDSIAFVPEFDLLDAGKEFIEADEVKFDAETIENFSRDLVKNERFMKCLRESFGGKAYVNGEWTDIDTKTDEKGLTFDEESDVAVAACSVIMSIIEILCNNKDASTEIAYDVPGLGKFKVSPVKGGYSVSLIFDKEFKGNCKSDKLAEKLTVE